MPNETPQPALGPLFALAWKVRRIYKTQTKKSEIIKDIHMLARDDISLPFFRVQESLRKGVILYL